MAIFFPQSFPKGKKMGQNPKILPQILVHHYERKLNRKGLIYVLFYARKFGLTLKRRDSDFTTAPFSVFNPSSYVFSTKCLIAEIHHLGDC